MVLKNRKSGTRKSPKICFDLVNLGWRGKKEQTILMREGERPVTASEDARWFWGACFCKNPA